ncbi:hypothetical protein SIN09_29155, partial [Streptomyces sp. F8]
RRSGAAPLRGGANRPRRPARTGRADAYLDLRSTFLAQILTKQGGSMVGLYEVFHVKAGGAAPVEEKEYQASLGHLKTAIASCPAPPTVLVADRKTADRIRQDLAAAGTPASVVHAPLP